MLQTYIIIIIIIYFTSGSMAHKHKTQRTEDIPGGPK